MNLIQNGEFMTEQNNRVLARKGARNLTPADIEAVGAGFSTPILFTETLTNGGKDHFFDEKAA